jgi:hypothetical protein
MQVAAMSNKNPLRRPSGTPSRSDKLQVEAKRFITSLIGRLDELRSLSDLARRLDVFSDVEFLRFTDLYARYEAMCEEFQVLSELTAHTLSNIDRKPEDRRQAIVEMAETLDKLQLAMIQLSIRSHCELLRLWRDRLGSTIETPLAAREILKNTVRIIFTTRLEMLRPRYVELLDDQSVADAEEAGQLLRTLFGRVPRINSFAASDAEQRALWHLVQAPVEQ